MKNKLIIAGLATLWLGWCSSATAVAINYGPFMWWFVSTNPRWYWPF